MNSTSVSPFRLSAGKPILTILILLVCSLAIAIDSARASESEKAELFDKLLSATNETQGRAAEDQIWQYWMNQAPNTEVRALLDRGMQRRQAYAYEEAEALFDQVVELAPDYAEGYNQRAFIRFLRENYTESLTDLETVLQLEPKHFGAWAGMFHVFRNQSRLEESLNMLKKAVEIHPWIQERHGLPEPMWPAHYRKLHKRRKDI